MIDYQYFPDVDDPIAKLRSAMDNMDGMYFTCGSIVARHLEGLWFSTSGSPLLVHNSKGKQRPQTAFNNFE